MQGLLSKVLVSQMIDFVRDDIDWRRFENRTEYVSVVITYVNNPNRPKAKRWELLENCIDSIHRHADHPFEIIVVDDSGLDLTSLDVKDKVSTLILNLGRPLGQSVQQNRGIRCATSKYIMAIEDDCEITRPCFKDLMNVLDKPYVGFINPEGMHPGEYLMHGDTKFIIGGGLAGAWCNCFRKDVWKEVGGLPDWSHQAIAPFCQKILKYGYWRAYLVGDRFSRNVDYEDYKQERSSGLVFHINHYPKLFNIPEHNYIELSKRRHTLSMKNCNDYVGTPGGTSNMSYWADYVGKLQADLGKCCISSIDWELAERHGQAKWKEQILAENIHREAEK